MHPENVFPYLILAVHIKGRTHLDTIQARDVENAAQLLFAATRSFPLTWRWWRRTAAAAAAALSMTAPRKKKAAKWVG
jgi:hypothetical protein